MIEQFEVERRQGERLGTTTERLRYLTRRTAQDRAWRCIEWTHLPEAQATELIEAEIRVSADFTEGWEWKVYGTDRPADLLERLRRRGFHVGPRETTMGFDLADVGAMTDSANEIEVRAIATEEDLGAFRRIAETLFKKDFAYTTGHLRQSIGLERPVHRGFLALDKGTPIAIGCLYATDGSEFGYLYCGGTLPDHRGKGAYRSLVRARAIVAEASGYRYLMIDALPTSEPIVRKLGFQEITKTWPCTWPGTTPKPDLQT